MKTSFYFFLWSIVYVLIDLTGMPTLIEHSFLTAWIFVLLVWKACNKLFEKEDLYQTNLNRQFVFEIFYNNQPQEFARVYRRQLLLETAIAVYCILVIIGLLAFEAHEYFAYIIFGFFALVTSIRAVSIFTRLRKLKRSGLPPFAESDFAADEDIYNEYCQQRSLSAPEELAPEAPKMSKWLNAFSMLFAVLCILGGLLQTLAVLVSDDIQILDVTCLIWLAFAIYFGIKDCIASVSAFRGKPMPSMK